ncbi:uncharacterized protein LOC111711890 [Eurytemora carolleeae]|uniref:uncharacterized protein LOC111711890 n=1 Tax=Eurytemora carolleeae TaxID=1294199 RepID=UPI000C7742F3|nr:uncharacterized protein LOC111711890 [Eurytemora carolleeae]|eukprot:XP_023342118.1 uncharacterized protein LOC111711890 [Eurytemora affinis]
MTNISVIRGVNSIAESCGPNSKVLLKLGNLDFKPEKSKHEFVDWTNFHCILTIGIIGFFIFWVFLLLRMYLPLENVLMIWWLKKPNKTMIANFTAPGLPGS